MTPDTAAICRKILKETWGAIPDIDDYRYREMVELNET